MYFTLYSASPERITYVVLSRPTHSLLRSPGTPPHGRTTPAFAWTACTSSRCRTATAAIVMGLAGAATAAAAAGTTACGSTAPAAAASISGFRGGVAPPSCPALCLKCLRPV